MYTAAAMAMAHGADMFTAQVAGLLHDCAKCIPNKEKLSCAERIRYRLRLSRLIIRFSCMPSWGAFLARKKYGVKEKESWMQSPGTLQGRPAMSKLEQIIYIADYIEPGRDRALIWKIFVKSPLRIWMNACIGILKDTMRIS